MNSLVLWNTVVIVLGTCLLSTLIAFPLAWLVARTELPGAKLWTRLFSLPYILPSYLLAVSWVVLANPQVGVLNELLRALGANPEKSFFNVYSLGGIIFVESTALFSIIFVNLRLAYSKIDSTLEEAARLSGAGPIKTFVEITFPLLWPSLFAALLSVLLASLASFGVPAMLGGANRIYVLTTSIYSNLRSGSDEGFSMALWQSLGLGLFSLLLVFVLRSFQRKTLQNSSAKLGRRSLLELGTFQYPLVLLLLLFCFVLSVLPLLTLFAASFSGGGVALWDFAHWNLKAWRYVLFELPNFRAAVFNTIKASVGAAALAVLLSFALALLRWKFQRQASKWGLRMIAILEDAGVFLFSLPGTVLAVGLLFLSIKLSFLGLQDSLWILLVAYFLKSFNLGNKVLFPATHEIPSSVIEAAKICGASPRQILFHIWLPLLKAALIAAFFVSLMPMLGELSASLMLYGPETETLGVLLFQLQEYADRPSAAVVGTMLVLGVFLLHLLDRSSVHGE